MLDPDIADVVVQRHVIEGVFRSAQRWFQLAPQRFRHTLVGIQLQDPGAGRTWRLPALRRSAFDRPRALPGRALRIGGRSRPNGRCKRSSTTTIFARAKDALARHSASWPAASRANDQHMKDRARLPPSKRSCRLADGRDAADRARRHLDFGDREAVHQRAGRAVIIAGRVGHLGPYHRGYSGPTARTVRPALGPNRPRVGVPAAAARCIRPVSLPMNRAQRRNTEAGGQQIGIADEGRSPAPTAGRRGAAPACAPLMAPPASTANPAPAANGASGRGQPHRPARRSARHATPCRASWRAGPIASTGEPGGNQRLGGMVVARRRPDDRARRQLQAEQPGQLGAPDARR